MVFVTFNAVALVVVRVLFAFVAVMVPLLIAANALLVPVLSPRNPLKTLVEPVFAFR